MIWALSLISFALPAYLIRLKVFGIPTTVLEILIYLAVLIQLMGPERKALRSLFKKPISYLLYPISLFVLATIISTIISPEKKISLGILKGWIFDPILLFGLVASNVRGKEDFKKIIYGLLGGATIVALWGILQALGFSYLLLHQRSDPFQSFPSYLSSHRAFGPFESPNYLGMYLAPISAIALGQLLNLNLKSQNLKLQIKNQNYFLSFAVAVSLLALFFTKSFGAWFGLGVALIFLVWLYLPKEKRPGFYAFLILAMIIFSALIFKYHPQRILDSFAARKEVWQVSWYLIAQHPILGIGLGTFPKIYNQVIPQIHFPPINWLQMHPHNIFLAFWLDVGLLGLVSFIWLLYLFFRKAILLIPNNPITISIIAAMLTILAHGLIDTTYWKNDLSALFWILFGLVIAFGKLKEEK